MVHRLSRMRGFHVHARDGNIGHVDDFIVDETDWIVRYFVIDTSNWIGGKWVAVATAPIARVDWSERVIHMDLTREQIKNSPTLEEANVPGWELMPPVFIM